MLATEETINSFLKDEEPSAQKVYVRYLPGAPQIQKIEVGDWIDLSTYEDVTLHAGDFKLLSLGVAMKLPNGYEAWIAPRSSTFKRWGITQTNSIGVVDNSYCGNDDIWMMPVLAHRDITIPKGTRICQFRLMKKQDEPEFIAVQNLSSQNRGGFGSTGTGSVDA